MQKVQRIVETNVTKYFPLTTFLKEKSICRFLSSLVRDIEEADKSWMKRKKDILNAALITTVANVETDIPKSNMYNSGIDTEIRTHIETHSAHVSLFSNISIGERIYDIYIVQEAGKRLTQSKMRYIYCWLHVLQKHAPIRNTGASPPGGEAALCSKNVKIYLYLSSLQKLVPDSYAEPVCTKHVNTAVTTGCQHSSEVNIFRLEEWFKVLIHESFHNTGLDFIEINPDVLASVNKSIKQVFPVNVDDLRLYETWCEMWAEILYNLFALTMTKSKTKTTMIIQTKRRGGATKSKTKKSKSKPNSKSNNMISPQSSMVILRELDKRLTRESIFSSVQCSKLLRTQHLTYEDLCTNPSKTAKYEETTQCFCYYVLKGIWMIHFTDFLLFSVQMHSNTSADIQSSPIDFRLDNPDNHLQAYAEQLLSLALQKTTREFMSTGLKILETEVDDDFFQNTLRMSLYDV